MLILCCIQPIHGLLLLVQTEAGLLGLQGDFRCDHDVLRHPRPDAVHGVRVRRLGRQQRRARTAEHAG